MWVLLRCPLCRVRGNYNGRGLCSCRRAYLLHSFAGRTVEVPQDTFRWTPDQNGEFIAAYDDGAQEHGRWEPLPSGVYMIPDGRRRRVVRDTTDRRKPADFGFRRNDGGV